MTSKSILTVSVIDDGVWHFGGDADEVDFDVGDVLALQRVHQLTHQRHGQVLVVLFVGLQELHQLVLSLGME